VRVSAENAAGLEGALDSPPITVAAPPPDGLPPGVVVAIVCACMLGAAAVAGGTAYWLSRTRCAARREHLLQAVRSSARCGLGPCLLGALVAQGLFELSWGLGAVLGCGVPPGAPCLRPRPSARG